MQCTEPVFWEARLQDIWCGCVIGADIWGVSGRL